MLAQQFGPIATGYLQAPRVRDEVQALMNSIPSLQPKADNFFSNDGQAHSLLCLVGTIPILFKGQSYNIPVKIWVPKEFPMAPPMSYVTPTSDMVIRDNHKHVDKNGFCYLQYLSEWDSRRSTLRELISVLSSTFSMDPPLFSRPKQTPAPVHQPYHHPPQSTLPMQYPPPQTNPYNPPSPVHPRSVSYPQIPLPVAQNFQPVQAYPQRQSSTNIIANPYSEQAHKGQLIKTITERFTDNYVKYSKKTVEDIESSMKTQTQLSDRKDQIQFTLQKGSDQLQKLDDFMGQCYICHKELAKFEASYNENQDVDIDDTVVPEDPLSKQLFNLIAEDSAIEDVVYHLEKALAENIIDLESFLKETRTLARQQFFVRATAKKVKSLMAQTGKS